MSYKKVDIKELSVSFKNEISNILQEYGVEAESVVVDCASNSGDVAKKMLAGSSAKKTGKYAKGWRKKTEKKRYSTEVIVYAGDAENLYWIEQKGTADEEKAVLDFIAPGISQGTISLFDFEEERISVIKVGSSYYCRRVPVITLSLEEAGE